MSQNRTYEGQIDWQLAAHVASAFGFFDDEENVRSVEKDSNAHMPDPEEEARATYFIYQAGKNVKILGPALPPTFTP